MAGNPAPATQPDTEARSKAFAALGSVVAPTTLVTALLFYFGRLHATGYFGYFGVNFTAIGLTPTDYLVRSADGLFIPVAVGSAALLVGTVVDREIVVRRLGPHPGTRRALSRACVAVGLLLVLAAAVGVASPALFDGFEEWPGLFLAGGTLLGVYARRLARMAPGRRPTAVPLPAAAEWIGVFLLVSVGLFWSVGNYAFLVGSGRGHDTLVVLGSWPDVTLYSAEGLHLTTPGVEETPCGPADKPTSYRTTGLKLILDSGERYFLLPAGWTPDTGGALLVPKADDLRLQFDPAGATTDTPC